MIEKRKHDGLTLSVSAITDMVIGRGREGVYVDERKPSGGLVWCSSLESAIEYCVENWPIRRVVIDLYKFQTDESLDNFKFIGERKGPGSPREERERRTAEAEEQN